MDDERMRKLKTVTEQKMELKDIHVGDKVRIRGWKDMVRSFCKTYSGDGLMIVQGDGDDASAAFFPIRYRLLCGREFTIKRIRVYDPWVYIDAEEDFIKDDLITLQMIEPVE